MQRWIAEVLALKPNKRVKWNGHLDNQTRTRSIICYYAAGLREAGVQTHFVQKLNEERKGKRGTNEDWISASSFSDRATIVDNQVRICNSVTILTPEGTRPLPTANASENVYYHNGSSLIGGVYHLYESRFGVTYVRIPRAITRLAIIQSASVQQLVSLCVDAGSSVTA